MKAFLKDAKIVNKQGETVSAEDLSRNKLVGFYFSAHWCGPCRNFTPKLVEFYNKLKETGKEFEVVFCSSDQDEAAWKSYWGEMPWPSMVHGDKRIGELKKDFGVSGIPWLAVCDNSGKLIVNEADEEVPQGVGCYDKWVAKL